MRYLFLLCLALSACGGCGPKAPKPKSEVSSKNCPVMKCDAVGRCECRE